MKYLMVTIHLHGRPDAAYTDWMSQGSSYCLPFLQQPSKSNHVMYVLFLLLKRKKLCLNSSEVWYSHDYTAKVKGN